MAKTDPRHLRPADLVRALNSTPLGEVASERHLYRHRMRAGYRIGESEPRRSYHGPGARDRRGVAARADLRPAGAGHARRDQDVIGQLSVAVGSLHYDGNVC